MGTYNLLCSHFACFMLKYLHGNRLLLKIYGPLAQLARARL